MLNLYNKINPSSIFKFLIFIWILSIPFKNAVFQISIVLISIFFLYHLLKTRSFNILFDNLKETKNLFIGFSFIIFAMILSNLLNPEFLDKKSWHTIFSFIFRYGLILIILAYFYRLDFFKKKDIIVVTLFSFFFLLLTGVYQIIQEPNIVMGEGIKGTLNNRNAFGLMMGMGFVTSFYLLNYKRNFGLVLLLLFSFFMIFSFSRSSWVASSFSFIILLALNYKNIKISHIVYFSFFMIFLALLYFSFDSFQHRFEQLLNGNSSNRTTIWLYTIEFIKEKIFFGYGLNSFKNLPNDFLNQFPDPHNSILEILLYTGLFGLISCVFTIFIVLKKIYDSKNFILFPIATYFIVVTQFDFGAYGSKELLSFLTIFVFFVYADSFRKTV
ncbi:O-antigen ligase family protein [Arcobacter ellisii]|uniref:O-antigen ligase family protein n=1 Tax=Arcobacter ellisii TaxID=913109 RepID=A0A347UAF6_9BACT|nr:O-antigen ligase family protein [Arcobacter ellisii]RXI29694.1 O-antigen polymerase [Arcobacter ellisii]